MITYLLFSLVAYLCLFWVVAECDVCAFVCVWTSM